jgi:hypothetical protein
MTTVYEFLSEVLTATLVLAVILMVAPAMATPTDDSIMFEHPAQVAYDISGWRVQ